MKNKIIEQVKAEVKAKKQPKTIKVKSVVIAVIVAIAIVAAFVGGVFYAKTDSNRVVNEAKVLIKDLKSTK